MTQQQQTGQAGSSDQRPEEIRRLLEAHPSLVGEPFWDDLFHAVKDLVNGNTEQVCLNRQQDQGPIRVQWEPITRGQKEHWEGTGPG